MSKLALSNLADLQNEATAVTTINANNDTIEAAFDNTLSRNGASPNTMGSNFDMNSNRIVNLPKPVNNSEPLRLQDLVDFNSGGSFVGLPTGGTTNQVLLKNSNTNYDAGWGPQTSNVQLGSTVVTGGTSGKIFYNNAGVLGEIATSGSGVVALTNSPNFTTPNIGASTAASVNKVIITQPASSATLTIADSKTLTAYNGQYVGTATNDSATAGNIGEVISSIVAVGSALSLTTATALNITSMSLTAGEWDVYGYVSFVPAVTTSVTQYLTSISTTTGTLDVTTPFAFNQISTAAQVPGGANTTNLAGPVRFQLSGSQTIYLVARAIFTVSTMTAFGAIRARRIR